MKGLAGLPKGQIGPFQANTVTRKLTSTLCLFTKHIYCNNQYKLTAFGIFLFLIASYNIFKASPSDFHLSKACDKNLNTLNYTYYNF